MNVPPAVRRDSIATLFYPLSTSFKGLGICLRLLHDDIDADIRLKLHELPFQFAHVVVSTPDPSPTVLNIESYSDMDSIFTGAPYALGGGGEDVNGNEILSSAGRFFKDVKERNMRIILSFLVPPSWLVPDGSFTLTGDRALKGYANYILSGVLFARSFGLSADLVQIFYKTDDEGGVGEFGWISPTDMIILMRHLRDISIARNITQPSIKFLSPALHQVLPIHADQDVYTQALLYAKNNLDIFSITAEENDEDISLVNSGTFDARYYLSDRLGKNVAQMNSINPSVDKISNAFSTKATKFPRIKISSDENPTLFELIESEGVNKVGLLPEHAIRIVENLCGILRNGLSVAVYGGGLSTWKKTKTAVAEDGEESTETVYLNGGQSLYSDNGSLQPVGKVLAFLLAEMPIPGDLYISEELNRLNDQTIKTLVMSSTADKFFFTLCRPVLKDPLNGVLRLVVNNPLWSTSYQATELLIRSFPDAMVKHDVEVENEEGDKVIEQQVVPGVDLSSITIKTKFSQGSCTFDLKGLPYGGCVLFFSGKVSLIPPAPPPPAPPAPPVPTPGGGTGNAVVMSTIMQLPVNFNYPAPIDYVPGTLYFDSKFKVIKVFTEDKTWITATLLPYY